MFRALRCRSVWAAVPYAALAVTPAVTLPRQQGIWCGGDAPTTVTAKRPAGNFSTPQWGRKRGASSQGGNISMRWSSAPKRSDAGIAKVAALALQPPNLGRAHHDNTVMHAAAPASQTVALPDGSLHSGTPESVGPANHTTAEESAVSRLALRLAAGRTVENLKAAMGTRLFAGSCDRTKPSTLDPDQGLCATLWGGPVLILKTFPRYGIARAHVVPLKAKTGTDILIAKLGDAHTCNQSDLTHVGPHYVVMQHKSTRSQATLKFKAAEPAHMDFQDTVRLRFAFTRFSQVW